MQFTLPEAFSAIHLLDLGSFFEVRRSFHPESDVEV